MGEEAVPIGELLEEELGNVSLEEQAEGKGEGDIVAGRFEVTNPRFLPAPNIFTLEDIPGTQNDSDSMYPIADSLYRPEHNRYKNQLTLKLPTRGIFRGIGMRPSKEEAYRFYESSGFNPNTEVPFDDREPAQRATDNQTGSLDDRLAIVRQQEIERRQAQSIENQRQPRELLLDQTRKRGIYKYFLCNLYYKGGLDEACKFNVHNLKKCHFYIQFYENPSDSLTPPPDHDWGKLRPTIFRNPRAAMIDVQQWYEMNIDAPDGSSSLRFTTPNEFLGYVNDSEEQVSRQVYKLRPESARVTNTSFRQLFIYGTGLPFEAYKNMELHKSFDKRQFIYTLNELSHETAEEQKDAHDWLAEQNPKLAATCLPTNLSYGRKESKIYYNLLKRQKFRVNNEERWWYVDIPSWARRILGQSLQNDNGNYLVTPDYRLPSLGLAPEFKRIIDMNDRLNIIEAQPAAMDLPHDPMVQNWAMRGKTRDAFDKARLKSTRRISEQRFNPWDTQQRFYEQDVRSYRPRMSSIYSTTTSAPVIEDWSWRRRG